MIQIARFFGVAALSAALMLGQHMGPRANGTPPDPTTMIQNKVARLTTLLTLTTAQQTQATTIFTNAFTSSQSVMTSLQTDQQSLSDAVKANNSATIDQVAGTIGTLQGQLAAINAKANAAFYAILTADQQAKFDALPHGGPGFGPPGGGPGGPGGPPPPGE